MTDELRDEWTCWELLHSGEGPRGRSVVAMGMGRLTASEAAQEAAGCFDDAEAIFERWDNGEAARAFDGAERYIEVETSAGVERFTVVCEVVRRYHARPMEVQSG